VTLLPERKWTPSPPIGSPGWTNGSRGQSDSALGAAIDPIEASVRRMGQVRTFVSELLGELTDRQWEELCAGARGATSEEDGITRVVLRTTALLQPAEATAPPAEATAPPAEATAPPAVADESPAATDPAPAVAVPAAVPPSGPYDLLPIPPGFGELPRDAAPAQGVSAPDVAVGLHPPPPRLELERHVEVEASPAPELSAPVADEWSDLLPIPPGFAASPMPLPPMPAGLTLVPVPSNSPQTQTARRRRAHAHARADVRRHERRLSITAWVRNIGAIILLFTAWQLWGTAITQHHSQNQLQQSFDSKLAKASAPKTGFTLVPATVQLPDAPLGTAVAQLQIPKIGLDQFVVSGTGSDQLSLGPGHYLGTAQPGQAGNVAIAGHRTTHGAPFNRLAELGPGDLIYLTTTTGHRLTYVVSTAPYPVSPANVTVLNNFGDARLTLTTCNPEFSARQRLIVTAAYLPPGATHPEAIAKGDGHPYKLVGSLTSGWGWGLLPAVLVLSGLLVLLGLYNRRLSGLYGRHGRWLILIPIWIALLLALFETLVNFLPATV